MTTCWRVPAGTFSSGVRMPCRFKGSKEPTFTGGAPSGRGPRLRTVRKRGPRPLGAPPVKVGSFDPLNLQGILTPDEKVPAGTRQHVVIA